MKRKRVFILCLCLAFCIIGASQWQRLKKQPTQPRTFAHAIVEQFLDENVEQFEHWIIFGRPIVASEKWKAEKFFESPAALEVCAAISDHDHRHLRDLLQQARVDCNAQGKFGFTLLYWAYAEHDLEAFRILLEAGADPDLLLSDPVFLRTRTSMASGDSILFSTLRHYRYDFFLAALQHSNKVDQTGCGNQHLLHVFLAPDDPSNYSRFGFTSEHILAEMLRTGMATDQANHYCSYPTHLAIQNNRVSLCLMLLKSGADPSLENGRGLTVGDILAENITRFENWNGPGKPRDGLEELLNLLIAHGIEVPNNLEAVHGEPQAS